jgi:hypothetical protein
MANPDLDETKREELVSRLMSARRVVRDAKQSADLKAEVAAHKAINDFKRALGERGPVWWKDGSPDLNWHLVKHPLCRLVRENRAGPPRRNLNA